MEEVTIKVPAGVDLEKLKKLPEADAEFLAKAMKKSSPENTRKGER
ncbi:hypothetical protein [Thermococcus sp.]